MLVAFPPMVEMAFEVGAWIGLTGALRGAVEVFEVGVWDSFVGELRGGVGE